MFPRIPTQTKVVEIMLIRDKWAGGCSSPLGAAGGVLSMISKKKKEEFFETHMEE